jgi:hypothetical protein
VFTDCKNNRFQKKLIGQNRNIWISAPPPITTSFPGSWNEVAPIIDIPAPLLATVNRRSYHHRHKSSEALSDKINRFSWLCKILWWIKPKIVNWIECTEVRAKCSCTFVYLLMVKRLTNTYQNLQLSTNNDWINRTQGGYWLVWVEIPQASKLSILVMQ